MVLRQGAQFVVVVVLARLLTPAEFGTVALLSLFVGISSVIVDAGLSTALIQRGEVSTTDESTAFWLNVLFGALVAGALVAMAPAVAAFYDIQVLGPLTMVMALTVLVNAFASVPVALLVRRLDFGPMLLSGVAGTLISGTVAVVLAWSGYGVWALAAQTVSMSVVSTVVLWAVTGWRPRLEWDGGSALSLFSFGGFVFLANLSDMLFVRIYTLLAGKMFGVRDVGFYNRADTAQQMPVDTLGAIASRVMLPIFSANADRQEELRQGTRLAIRVLMLLSVPVLLGLAVAAEPFVLTVFGGQWGTTVPLLEILCLAGVLWPLQVVNVQVLLAQGHARLALFLEVGKKAVGAGMLITGALVGGLVGLAWGQVGFALVAFVANTHFTGMYLDYGFKAQLRDCLPIFLAALPSLVAVRMLTESWAGPPVIELLVSGGIVALGFIGVSRLIKLDAMEEAMGVLRRARTS